MMIIQLCTANLPAVYGNRYRTAAQALANLKSKRLPCLPTSTEPTFLTTKHLTSNYWMILKPRYEQL